MLDFKFHARFDCSFDAFYVENVAHGTPHHTIIVDLLKACDAGGVGFVEVGCEFNGRCDSFCMRFLLLALYLTKNIFHGLLIILCL